MDDLIRFQLPQSRFIAAVDPVIARAQHGMDENVVGSTMGRPNSPLFH
jgi:hypothetical protein